MLFSSISAGRPCVGTSHPSDFSPYDMADSKGEFITNALKSHKMLGCLWQGSDVWTM